MAKIFISVDDYYPLYIIKNEEGVCAGLDEKELTQIKEVYRQFWKIQKRVEELYIIGLKKRQEEIEKGLS